MDDARQTKLRTLPKIDEVLARPEIQAISAPRWAVTEAVRRAVASRRQALLDGTSTNVEVLAEEIAAQTEKLTRPSLRRIINATGVVLHTNFGRAPLAEAAITRVVEVASAYTNLEYDVEGRARGSRHEHSKRILAQLTGAEDALVVNNNAAAVLLSLSALAAGREVVVSRGELVEIGGSFRIPDVMRASGARLVEVGTTNKTHLADYENALTADTALLLKVHRSNFAMIGFVADVSAETLVEFGHQHGLPTVIDLGSGTLLDPAGFGLAPEPTVFQTLKSGADVVTFSGDKLLGGPQAGILVGKADAISRLKKHPLLRALRPDKMTLAALEATLELYRDGTPLKSVPALRMLSVSESDLRVRAEALAGAIGPVAKIVSTASAVGGGALPTSEPASWGVAIVMAGETAETLDGLLRQSDPPVIGRIVDDELLLDVRTLLPGEDAIVAEVVWRAVKPTAGCLTRH